MSNDPKKPETVTATPVPTSMENAVKQAIEAALPAAVAVGMRIAAEAAPKPAGAYVRPTEKCNECYQLVVACGGKHRRAVVYPKAEKFAKWFQGVFLNGVKYLSNHRGHMVTIPAESSIENTVALWEENEEVQASGRNIQHNSGSMGPNGSNTNPAHYGMGR